MSSLLEQLEAMEKALPEPPSIPSCPKIAEPPGTIVKLTGIEALVACHQGEVVHISRRMFRQIIEHIDFLEDRLTPSE